MPSEEEEMEVPWIEGSHRPMEGDPDRLYTVRVASMQALRDWRDWLVGVWDAFATASRITDDHVQRACYRRLLTSLEGHLANPRGVAMYTPSLRLAVHELQDLCGVARTVFPPVV